MALLLAFTVPVRAETTADPLWTLFTSYAVDRDEKAASSTNEGAEDAKRLASLQADLQLLAGGFESFRDESQVKENLVKLEPLITPELRPYFKDRSSSLETIYRTLAVTDYTWAVRFPAPPCSPVQARHKLLDSRDGLFQNAKGESSAWLVSLLGPQAEGKSVEQALDQASAKNKLGAAEYEKRRSLIRKLTLALASDKAVGEARAKLYCLRASVYADLAASQGPAASAPTLAARLTPSVAPEPSVFVVMSGARRGAATMVETKFGPVLVTDAAITAADEHLRLVTRSGAEVTATVVRRDETLGLATLAFDGKAPGLPLTTQAPVKDELVTALGHTEVSGLWTKTSGLVSKSGPDSFQTDAAISADFSGGPVLNDAGEVAGLLVLRPADTEEGRWPVAVPAGKIALWLEGAQVSPGPVSETIEDAGTAAVLSRTRPNLLATNSSALWNASYSLPDPPRGNIVCMRYCGSPSTSGSGSSSSGGSSYSNYSSDNGGKELGEALGKLAIVGISGLFRGIGKLFSRKESAPAKLVDNRRHAAPAPSVVQKAAEPPKEQLRPSGLELILDRTAVARGEVVVATVKMSFTGEEGTRAGKGVTFEVDPQNAATLEPRTATTDGNGTARARVLLTALSEGAARFDALGDYEAKMRGEKVAEAVNALPKPGDAVGVVKARELKQGDDLDREALKYQVTGEPPFRGASESRSSIIIQGQTVTITATAAGLRASAHASVTDKRCPAGTAARPLDPENVAPGEPARGDTTEKLHEAACDEIVREAQRICGEDKECVAAEREKKGYASMGCGAPRSGTPAYDRASPPSWLPKEKRPEPRYECVPSVDAAVARGPAYRSETTPDDSDLVGGVALTQEELISRIWAILKPDGEHWIGTRKGDAISIKGTLEDTKNLFNQLTKGMAVGQHPNQKLAEIEGKLAKLENVSIGLRPYRSTQSKPPTIDVKVPGRDSFEVKFINDP